MVCLHGTVKRCFLSRGEVAGIRGEVSGEHETVDQNIWMSKDQDFFYDVSIIQDHRMLYFYAKNENIINHSHRMYRDLNTWDNCQILHSWRFHVHKIFTYIYTIIYYIYLHIHMYILVCTNL